jgi:transcription termination factor NusA
MDPTKLTEIAGVGPDTARRLADRGITSVEQLASLSIEELAAVPGFGPKRAVAVSSAAKGLFQPPPTEPEIAKEERKKGSQGSSKNERRKDKHRKRKKDGKGKKGKKGKKRRKEKKNKKPKKGKSRKRK